MSDRVFNTIRFWAEVGISAICTLYGSIADIWGLPYGESVLQTGAALGTFLGIFTIWQRYRHNKQEENDEEDLPFPK